MKRLFGVAAILIAILLVIAIALPFAIDPNRFRPLLESTLTKSLGREVKVGNLKLAILSGGVTADDLSVADDPVFSRTPFVQAKSLKLGVELWPLIVSLKLNVTSLTIDAPQIALLQSASGAWNFSSLGAGNAASREAAPPGGTASPAEAASSKAGMDLSVKLVEITGGRFTMSRMGGSGKPLVLENVNAELRDFSATTVFPFSLSLVVAGGGAVKLDGKAGPLDSGDMTATPVSATLKVSQLDLAGSGVNQAAPTLAGIVTVDGNGESNGATVGIKGRVHVEKLKLVKNGSAANRPVEFDFAVQHDMKKHSGALRQGDVHIGAANASLTGTYAERGELMVLNMILAAPGVAVPELAAMLPAMGVELPKGSSLEGGTVSAKVTVEGPTDKLVTAGTVSLAKTRLVAFDLSQKLSTVEKLAGIKGSPNTEIELLTSNVRMAPEGTSADGIKLVLPALGELDGSGVISPENALDFKMRATVHGSGVMAVLGNTPVPFLVGGTCADPVFRPDLKAVAAEKVKGIESQAAKAAGGLLKGLLGGHKKD